MGKYRMSNNNASPVRHAALDGVRGLAALIVANYHWLHHGAGITIPSMGTFPVYLFFSLSALTMIFVYGGRIDTREDVVAFYRNRVFRIMPLLALTSLATAALNHFDPEVTLRAVLTATGLFATAPGLLSVGNGAWSIGIELVFYAIFPIVAATVPGLRTRSLFAILAVLIVIQQTYIWTIGTSWAAYISPLTFAPFFAIGLLIHRAPRSGGSLIAAALALFALASASLVVDVRGSAAAYLAAMAIAALVLWLAWRSEVSPAIEPLCDFLGRISYSLYLTHWFAFVVTRKLGLGWPAFIALAILAAWLCERWFERPVQIWLRQRAGRRAPVPQPAS